MGKDCFELNLTNKCKSESVSYIYKEYYKKYSEGLLPDLYWPYVRRTFEKEWIEIILETDSKKLQILWDKMEKKYL